MGSSDLMRKVINEGAKDKNGQFRDGNDIWFRLELFFNEYKERLLDAMTMDDLSGFMRILAEMGVRARKLRIGEEDFRRHGKSLKKAMKEKNAASVLAKVLAEMGVEAKDKAVKFADYAQRMEKLMATRTGTGYAAMTKPEQDALSAEFEQVVRDLGRVAVLVGITDGDFVGYKNRLLAVFRREGMDKEAREKEFAAILTEMAVPSVRDGYARKLQALIKARFDKDLDRKSVV